MIKPMGAGFSSTGGYCYCEGQVWDLRTLEQFQGIEMSPGLFQEFMDVYLKS